MVRTKNHSPGLAKSSPIYKVITSVLRMAPLVQQGDTRPGHACELDLRTGAGKSCIMEAVAFVAGCSAAALRVEHLADLQRSESSEVIGLTR